MIRLQQLLKLVIVNPFDLSPSRTTSEIVLLFLTNLAADTTYRGIHAGRLPKPDRTDPCPAIMSTAARRRLMRDFKVCRP